MQQRLSNITFLVNDYDEAISFFVNKLHFTLLEDTVMSETKRWVRVAPPGDPQMALLLAKAANEEQKSRVGNQTGGRVFLFLYTDDFERDFKSMISQGIEFVRGPVREEYGMVGVFKDLYGNLWDFIQPS